MNANLAERSGTITTTIYEPPQPKTYLITLKNPETKVNYKETLDKLADIFERYFTWDDLISEKIKAWGEGALNVDVESKSAEAIKIKVEADIARLFNEVLISSKGWPLKSPILDGKHTWEYQELIEYCQIYKFSNSPFDGVPMNFTLMKVHAFAMEMIAWASVLPIEIEQGTIQSLNGENGPQLVLIETETGVPSYEESNRKMNQCLVYGRIAEQKLHDFRISRNMKNATAECKVCKEKIQVYIDLGVKRAAREAERMAEAVREEIRMNNKAHEAKVNILKSNIEELKGKLRMEFEKLSEAEQQNALNRARIDHLSQVYAQKLQEVERLRQEARRNSKGCPIF